MIDLILGDCLVEMPKLAEASVDSIVCDPPYGLEFMGTSWDKLDWRVGGSLTVGGSDRFKNSPPLPSFSKKNPENRICLAGLGPRRD